MHVDAKRIADKYVARDGSPVPKIKARRNGYFFCSKCGKEEKIFDGASPEYVPNICVTCGNDPAEVAKQRVFDSTIIEGIETLLLPAAEQVLEEQKIEANEGKIDHKHVDDLRKNLESIRRLIERFKTSK